jgi:DNA-binding transcriptional MocR family regulator
MLLNNDPLIPSGEDAGPIWTPALERVDGPLYLALAAAIENAVGSGELPAGFQLPPQRRLADALGITAGTVNRGYAIARERGLVTGEVGRGTFVCGAPIIAAPSSSPAVVAAYAPAAPSLSAAPPPPAGLSRGVDLSCFRSPLPDLNARLAPAFAAAAARAAAAALHRYPPAAGRWEHREAGAQWLRRFGLSVAAEQTLITIGAQRAMFLALKALTAPGDAVLTEAVTYSGLVTVAETLGLRLIGAPMDDEGADPDALARLAQESGARVAFLQPSLHNPTTARMPAERRRRLAEIARSRGLIIIEDDTAAAAMTERPPPLATLAPERTVFIAGPSKCLSPALRIGVLAAPADLLGRIEDLAHLIDLAPPPFVGDLLAALLVDGLGEAVIADYRAAMAERYAVAQTVLAGRRFAAHPAAFYLWLDLPDSWSARDFAAAARDEGIRVAPADIFTVGPVAPRAVRVSLNGNATVDQLRDGLATLVRLSDARRRRLTVV